MVEHIRITKRLFSMLSRLVNHLCPASARITKRTKDGVTVLFDTNLYCKSFRYPNSEDVVPLASVSFRQIHIVQVVRYDENNPNDYR